MIDCTFEDGNKNNLRHVTVGCLVIKDGQILLSRRNQRLVEGGKWCLPGGYMERDETTAETATREVKEETGWNIVDLQLLCINDNPARLGDDRQNVDFIYFAAAVSDSGQHDDEADEQAWFVLTSLPAPSEIAFDHLDHIKLYISYLREPFTLPIICTQDRPSLM